MNNLIIVALGSALGGVSRYLLSDCVRRLFPTDFPLGTLVVNLAGCFVMGLLAGLLAHTRALSEARWLLLVVGFCGSFSTWDVWRLTSRPSCLRSPNGSLWPGRTPRR